MAVTALKSGLVIAQRFQLERLLGEGGMGAVWSAVHLVTKKRVALKFLKPAAASSPSHVRRFLREARAASAVRHPNVVEIHDIVELDDGIPVMVMDLLVGESLAERLARQRQLDPIELFRLLLPVISAVGTAHAAGIVHRDIKPDNVFLEHSIDGGIVPRILDFGIAKLSAQEGAAAETASLTRTGSIMGTPYYMAPEQVFGERDVDQRADVWAFGVILYEGLSGRRPIEGDNFGQLFKAIATGEITPLAQVAPHVPLEIAKLVERMLAKQKTQRPSDLREVFDVLRRYADVSVVSFAGARPEIDASRDESAAAFAPTLTPAPTPQQFYESGGTALIEEPLAGRSATAQSFSRTGGPSRGSGKSFKWLAGGLLAFGVTAAGLALFNHFQPDAAPGIATDSGLAASTKPRTPAATPAPATEPSAPALETPSALPAASAAMPPTSASAASKKHVAARDSAPQATASTAATAPAASAPPASTPARLPGGIAPNAPF